MTLPALAGPWPSDSANSASAWDTVGWLSPVSSESSEPLLESWIAPVAGTTGGTTGQDHTVRLEVIPGLGSETTQPWYEEEGMKGMRGAVDRMKALARLLSPRVQFSLPEVETLGDDDGVELSFVVVDVHIPRNMDGMAFRDEFFGRLADLLPPADLARLAVGVGRGLLCRLWYDA